MNSVDLLIERQNSGFEVGCDDDGQKLYIAVDGGGMAGVTSLGALHQLDEEGLLQYADGFAGSSAGNLNSAYAMTSQTLEGRDCYVDYLPDNKFIWKVHPVGVTICDGDWPIGVLPLPYVDIKVLAAAARDYRPLKVEKVVKDKRELAIGMSNLTLASAEIFTNHDFKEDPENLRNALVDSAKLPLGLIGRYDRSSYPTRRRHFGGEYRYADTGLYWPTTDTIARRQGATTVLNLVSRPRPTKATSLVQKAADRVQWRFCSNYSTDAKETASDAARYRDFIIGRFVSSDTIMIEDVEVTRIYPNEKYKLPSRQTQNKKILRSGFAAGRQAVIDALADHREAIAA